jgi:PhoD-like phosphatase
VLGAGAGVVQLPAGLETAAPSQPVPVLLLDHESPALRAEMQFTVSNVTARPGLILAAASPHEFVGATVEGPDLVLARYSRTTRAVLARAACRPLDAGDDRRLTMAIEGRRVSAALDEATVDADVEPPGRTPGILLVHPLDFAPSDLRVTRYQLESGAGYAATVPVLTLALDGPPSPSVALRAMSSVPAAVRFEWDGGQSPWQRADTQPYSARHEVPLRPGLRWRVRLRSLSSGAETVSEELRYSLPKSDAPLVMGAASCAKVWGERPYVGLRRFRQSAPVSPSMLVYQGDLGYPNNIAGSCYLSAPDFFADRFTRFLDDPNFVSLRRQMPVSFTLDDHDYGPRNNAVHRTVAPWAIPLWSRFHADRDDRGYTDWRYGDVHCLTLDGRRYATSFRRPPKRGRTRLGHQQLGWLREVLSGSDAELFVIFSATTFATRDVRDTWVRGWPEEYLELMQLFVDIQQGGRRVVILSGDAHSFRVHYHPYPTAAPSPSGPGVVEMICSGLRSAGGSLALPGDPTLDPERNVHFRSGMGSIEVDPPGTRPRRIRLRAISGDEQGDGDLFPPLVLPFRPVPGDVPIDEDAVMRLAEGAAD